MKNLKKLLSLVLISSSLIFIGCSKDEKPPEPAPVIPTTPCPFGYTGADCSVQLTPTAIIIDSIEVYGFQQYVFALGTTDWDDCCHHGDYRPDIRIKIKSGSTVLMSTPYFVDANYYTQYNFKDTYNFPYQINYPTSQFTLALYDYDVTFDELMEDAIFTPFNSSNGFPPYISIRGNNNCSFFIYVRYVF